MQEGSRTEWRRQVTTEASSDPTGMSEAGVVPQNHPLCTLHRQSSESGCLQGRDRCWRRAVPARALLRSEPLAGSTPGSWGEASPGSGGWRELAMHLMGRPSETCKPPTPRWLLLLCP